jgi:hypothetical protein
MSIAHVVEQGRLQKGIASGVIFVAGGGAVKYPTLDFAPKAGLPLADAGFDTMIRHVVGEH